MSELGPQHATSDLFAELQRLRPTLLRDARLDAAAQLHSEEMARRDVLDHVGDGGTTAFDRIQRAGFPWRAAAENIASGSADPWATLQQWVHSPAHRDAMMNELYTHAGIGHAVASSGRHYWTLDLATPAT